MLTLTDKQIIEDAIYNTRKAHDDPNHIDVIAQLNEDMSGFFCWENKDEVRDYIIGCGIRHESEDEKWGRMYHYYINDLRKIAETAKKYYNGVLTLRFCVVQSQSKWANADPVKMAADLMREGYVILFDNSAIKPEENRRLEKAVKSLANA